MAPDREYRNTPRGAYTPEDREAHPGAWTDQEEVTPPTADAERRSAELDAARAGTPQGGEAGGQPAVNPDGSNAQPAGQG